MKSDFYVFETFADGEWVRTLMSSIEAGDWFRYVVGPGHPYFGMKYHASEDATRNVQGECILRADRTEIDSSKLTGLH